MSVNLVNVLCDHPPLYGYGTGGLIIEIQQKLSISGSKTWYSHSSFIVHLFNQERLDMSKSFTYNYKPTIFDD